MKIRRGFVSNSSSSSFVVWFPHPIKSRDDLEQALFPGGKHNIEGGWSDECISADQTLDELWSQIQTPDEWRVQEILDNCENLTDEVYLEQRAALEAIAYDKRTASKFYDVISNLRLVTENWWGSPIEIHYNKHINCVRSTMIHELQSRDSNVPYSFEFEDHTVTGRVLEHGDQFDHLKHVKESHH